MALHIVFTLCFKSILVFLEETLNLDMFVKKHARSCNFIHKTQNDVMFYNSFQNFSFTVRLGFICLTVSSFLASVSFCSLQLPFLRILEMLTFCCLCSSSIQTSAMCVAQRSCPYAVDGLADLVTLGAILVLDLVLTSHQFLQTLHHGYNILVISLVYANAFAALMELRIKVWLKMKLERQAVADMRGATDAELRSYNDVCAICLVPMARARLTDCGHMFHGRCLRLLLQTNKDTCPLCKGKIFSTVGQGHISF